ncbi:hypothetical protein B0H11DRAFT_1763274, partial [Mycena galericulata]
NTSGSGKTRLLSAGLCCEWGLYFTSRLDTSSLGSYDLHRILTKLSGWALNSPMRFLSALLILRDVRARCRAHGAQTRICLYNDANDGTELQFELRLDVGGCIAEYGWGMREGDDVSAECVQRGKGTGKWREE